MNLAYVGDKQVGDQVNLERAMGAHVRFGGHFVQVRIIHDADVMPYLSDSFAPVALIFRHMLTRQPL